MDYQENYRGGFAERGGRGGYSQRGDRGGRGGGFRGQRGNFNGGGRGGPRGGYRQENQRGGCIPGGESSRLQGRLSRAEDGGDNLGPRMGIQERLSRPGQEANGAEESLQHHRPPRRCYRPPNSYSQMSVPAAANGGFGIPPPEEREAPVYADPIGASKRSGRQGFNRLEATASIEDRFRSLHHRTKVSRPPPPPHQPRSRKTAKTSWKKWPAEQKQDNSDRQMNKAEKILHQELAKARKYPNGINEPCRSDYEEMSIIPRFEEEEAEKDRELCLQLFEVIRLGVPLSPSELFKWYQDFLFDKDPKYRLENVDQLQEFIRRHPNVFELDDLDGTVCNKGMGYRRGIVYLACIVLLREKDREEGAKLTEIFPEIAALPTHSLDGPWLDTYIWEIPMAAPEQLLEFFTQPENKFLFEVTITDPSNPAESAYIRIRKEAKKIPSLWDSTLLIDENMDKTQTWWDQSRRWVLQGTIAVAQSDYAQAFITRGAFAGRAVFIVPADVGQGTANLATTYQAGAEAEIIGHLCLLGTNHVTACYLRLANSDQSHVKENICDEVTAMSVLLREEDEKKKLKQLEELMISDEESEEEEDSEDESDEEQSDEDTETDEEYSEEEESSESGS